MRIVIALGGKALVEPGQTIDPLQRSPKIERAAAVIAELSAEHEIVVTHGHGPRIGLLAMLAQTEHAQQRFPLDMIGTEYEGVIGHQLEVALRNACPNQRQATLTVQVEVDPADPAFAHFSKPIGPAFPAGSHAVREVARQRGWHLRIEGENARRMVPSPRPRQVFDADVIASMLTSGTTVTCTSSGGMPLAVGPDGRLKAVEAVVEKEMLAAALAEQLHADLLLIISDMPNVMRDWNTPNEKPISSITADTTKPQDFAEGTMRPKVEAACHFVTASGGRAAIGAIEDAVRMVTGARGTQIVPTWQGESQSNGESSERNGSRGAVA